MNMYTKHFEFYGQMINYFNKVCKNKDIESCYYYSCAEGYVVEYTYKKRK